MNEGLTVNGNLVSQTVLPVTQLDLHTHTLLWDCPCSQHVGSLHPSHLGTTAYSDRGVLSSHGRAGARLVTVHA